MKIILFSNRHATKPFFLLLPLLLLCCLFLSSCQKQLNYFDYVSELRSNVFLAETEGFSLKIYAVKKENPYAADGVPQASAPRFEAYLVAPEGNETVQFSFVYEGKEEGGEMSYDNVKGEYFYACSLDASHLSQIPCAIRYGSEELSLTATSVLDENTLTPQEALARLQEADGEIFTSLTDEYGFAGEIYMRLLFEEAPYYYVGVVDREGNVHAFLLNGKTGKILARREG